MISRRYFLAALASLSFSLALIPILSAQEGAYPARPVKVVVPFPAGGAADLTARVLGQKMAEILGQPFVIENMPGANGIIGTDHVAKAPADGHTILIAPREVFGINPRLHKSISFNPLTDLEPVGIISEGAYVLVVGRAVGVNTVGELIALAKSKDLSFSSFGIGSMAHLNLVAFAKEAGITMHHVPYKGAPAAVQAVVSSEVALTITTPPSALTFLNDGKLLPLATGALERAALLPDVPTLKEAGLRADVLTPAFFAMAAPRGTPKPVVAKLNDALTDAIAAPDVADRLTKSGLIPVGSTPEAMVATIKDDLALFGALIDTLGVKPE